MGDANEIARFLVQKYIDLKRPATNMKIQRLLYFVWVEYYRKSGKWLFKNPIQAWKFGPVIESVYFEFRIFAATPITYSTIKPPKYSAEMESFLSEFAERHLDRTVIDLRSMALGDEVLWKKYYVSGKRHVQIPFESIIGVECS